MTKTTIRLTCLFLALVLAGISAALPETQLSLAARTDKFPSVVVIRTENFSKEHVTYSATLIAAIDEAGIALSDNDRLSLPENTRLVPGQRYEVDVTRYEEVNLSWSGYALAASGDFTGLDDVLSRSGYSSLDLSDGSRLENNIGTEDGFEAYFINYVAVDTRTVRKYETIPFTTVTVDDPAIDQGKSVVAVAGENGTLARIIEEYYENDVFQGSMQIGTEVVKEPVQEVIHKGTKPKLTYSPLNVKTVKSTVQNSLNKIKDYLVINGNKSYNSFRDNGNGTLTIDGVTFSYTSMKKRTITMFDGLECCLQAHDHSPAINHNTFSGVPAQRGLVATLGIKQNGRYVGTVLPMGTVIFVVGYGLGVVADVHGAVNNPDMIDACYNAGEIRAGTATLGKINSSVYILKLP